MKYTKLLRMLRPGDIILVHGNHLVSKMIRIITLSYWNHCVMYLGNGLVIESDKGGIVTRPLHEFATKEIALYRHKKANALQLKKVCAYALKQKGWGYDWVGLLELAVLLLCGIRGNIREIGWKNHYLCSELVAAAYQRAGLRLTKYKPSQTSPADIDISPYLKRL